MLNEREKQSVYTCADTNANNENKKKAINMHEQ